MTNMNWFFIFSILGDFEEAESMFTACCEIISSSDKSSKPFVVSFIALFVSFL